MDNKPPEFVSRARRTPLTPQSGKGKELCDLLRAELNIPEGVKSFEVRFAQDDVVSVRCEYIPLK